MSEEILAVEEAVLQCSCNRKPGHAYEICSQKNPLGLGRNEAERLDHLFFSRTRH